ncbi:MAG TPA: alpha/beta fold hydrolase [Syntrophales bacterium]|nr:alpha/beta fold hydrolase [Syntrophales bacterium]HOM07363.1 alpha/beta fold hydrolase [Syntrophales bacterium]HON98932.1 alpha/beta fold hydrolase [Syntrophales bacterium]HPC00396.1 alpha/beta fold hydrolase [Syntrophales bacterium]HPQ06999.1 alpha/beta fold hydrolase [Syntrophales bacterium]
MSCDHDYTPYDHPEILGRLFYPRPEWNLPLTNGKVIPLSIPVEGDVRLGAYFHPSALHRPTILFFHGNGEIASEYHDLAPFFMDRGLNFLPVDYRGYGRSGGRPTVSAMMADCGPILDFCREWLATEGYTGPLIVMGRSLGSAPALEIVHRFPAYCDALIIESGFAHVGPLFSLLGIDSRGLSLPDEDLFRHPEKIRSFKKPTLIIHAQFDHIIACSEGAALYEASGAEEKRFLKIKGANHNNIFALGMTQYMDAVVELAGLIAGGSQG